ncbi:protein ARV1 isoform X2 [Agrilus planipennis]|uniref:Protein ARV n=1 Tax=Agrilus planipennis TaxID=224129 RepID=A0A1W4WBK5_AGRPL|nr:protein ARV1 isoform X2 [Agrilus planipennis]
MMLNSATKGLDNDQTSNKYICINCGFQVKELYKQYSSNVLKLTVCENCYCEADKYIEFDLVLVIIDLVLLQRESYRHIINNTEFKGLWKLAFLILAMEAYANWSLTPTPTAEITNEFYIGDFKFYRILAGVTNMPASQYLHFF